MRVSEDILRDLAGLAENERSILSAYLDVRRGWAAVRTFIEKETQVLSQVLERSENEHFETGLAWLWDYLNEKKSDGSTDPGIAFFADLGSDYTCGVELYASPEPLLAVEQEAVVFPLAFQLDQYEPIGVIMIDASCMRILIAAGQVIESNRSLCERIHHLSKVGGWSQMRYQRRRAKEVKHFSREALAEAREVLDLDEVKRIVVAGRERMIAALENEFPEEWKSRIIATIRWDLDGSDRDLLERVRPYMEEAERREESDLLSLLTGELRRGGLATGGLEGTMRALKRGQVDTVLASTSLDPGTLDKLTHLAEKTGSHVEFLTGQNEALDKIGGVGALLRYKIRETTA